MGKADMPKDDAVVPGSPKKKKRDKSRPVAADADVAEEAPPAAAGKKQKRSSTGAAGPVASGSGAVATESAVSGGTKRRRHEEDAEKPRKKAEEEAEKPTKKVKGTSAATAAPDKPDLSQSEFRVFVSNIPKKIGEDMLRKDFEECGEIVNLKLLYDGHSEESRGLAFITFTDEAGFNAALEYDRDDYGGNTLRVRKAEAKGTKPKGHDPGPKPEGCNSVVVKRMSAEVSEDDLYEFFKSCGSGPTHVGVLLDKATGKSRCTARVDFEDGKAVDEAVKLLGSKLKGQGFIMNYCKPRSW